MKKSKQIAFDCKLLVLILYEIAATNTNTGINITICIVFSPAFVKGDKTSAQNKPYRGDTAKSKKWGRMPKKGYIFIYRQIDR